MEIGEGSTDQIFVYRASFVGMQLRFSKITVFRTHFCIGKTIGNPIDLQCNMRQNTDIFEIPSYIPPNLHDENVFS